ncbi:hypothetical protein AB1K54_09025 [Microbacterium sp. BWT-B31]|uniref:hypothetical protein n=1 Tax=Microbacterium sp. BWT-B31 TaxID=3232072 RepID=UPI0035294351
MNAPMLPSLDGRVFKLVSSTTSAVDAEAPSVFRYREQDSLVWGDYAGDTVTIGRFVGSREGDRIRISFAHVLVADGTVVTGAGESDLDFVDGRMRLLEHYTMNGSAQLSVCEEVLLD